MPEEGDPSKGKDKKGKKECNITAIKCSMFFINFLVMLAGLAVVHFGVLWSFKVTVIVDFTGKTSDNLSLLLMGIGVMVALVSYLGSFGAVLENMLILIFFKLLLILLFIGKIGCIVLLFVKKDFLDSTPKGEEEAEGLEEEEGEKSNENYQVVFSGILGAVGVLEVIVIALSIVLTHHIRTCPKHKKKGKDDKGQDEGHDDEGDDHEGDDDEGEE